MSFQPLDPTHVIEIVAAKLQVGATGRETLEALMSHGADQKEAKRAWRMARVGFDLALTRSIGIPATSSRERDPIVRAAVEYAKEHIGQPDCPRFLRRSSEVLKLLYFLLLVTVSIVGRVFVGLYASDKVILYVGYLAAAVALLGSPLIFYLIWLYGLDKPQFGLLGRLGRPLQSLLQLLRGG